MLNTSLRLTWRGLSHLTRFALVGVALLAFACGALMLVLRYWVLPDIERYHEIITISVSEAIGQPVSIGKVEADWRGIRPHLLLSDVRIMEKGTLKTALELQHVDGVLAWLSLVRGELSLYSLELDKPDLLVRRDTQGLLHIAGVTLAAQNSGRNDLADWLLHQKYIVVRDARITWLDEQRSTLPLVFNRLNLLIQNRGVHHLFAVNAQPPAEISSQLDVRGEFAGRSFNDLKEWHGQLYTRLDYADVAAWRTWLPLPEGFKSGRGALRSWLDITDGTVNQLTADLALADVHAQLADGLAPLNLHTLGGRISWMKSTQGMEVSTRQLALKTDGVSLHPTDFYLRLAYASDKKSAGGEVRANTLELANLVNLTDSLPLGRELKQQLAEFAPQGVVSGLQAKWQRDVDKPLHYEVKAQFNGLSVKRVGKLPGFSGLSGELDGSETTGTVSINSRKLTLDAPQIMPEPLGFDSLAAQAGWRVNKLGLEVKFSNVSASNSDLAGVVYGSFQTLPNSPGLLDLNIDLPHAAIRYADRYIPLNALDKETHAWLRNALLDGQADDFHLRLHGDLNDFPFNDSKKGVFQIKTHIRNGALDYAKGWPQISAISGELLIQDKRLEVNAPAAMMLGVKLQKAHVILPDLASRDLMMQVRGEAVGETSRALDFIQKSPVHDYIGNFTQDITARGSGSLQLAANIPLQGNKPVTVSGSYHFADNEVDAGNSVPVISSVNGDLLFTESTMHTKNLTAKILGGPSTLALQNDAAGKVQVRAHGKIDLDALRPKQSSPLLSRLHGGSEWDAEITLQKKLVNVLISSNLSGLSSDLPVPFSKARDEVAPLRFEMRSMAAGQDVISLQYGKLLNAKMFRREEDGNMVIKRGTLNFGGLGKWLNRDGVWITGTLPQLSLEGWGGLFSPGAGEAPPFTIAGADLMIQKLDAYGHAVNGLRVSARNQNGKLAAQLAAKEVNGEVSWQSDGKGKLVARLRNLVLGETDSGIRSEGGSVKNSVADGEIANPDVASSTEFPALDLEVEDLFWKDKQLGKMELLARQHGSDWLLEHLRITNPDGVLTADGKYHTSEGKAETQVNLKLEISNAGKILARSGYPDSVKNGSGKLEGVFAWRGAPDDFSYAALDGKLTLDTDKGQFLKIDAGVGKLLGILSLQALPKHITLDFSDVFSDGFAFDSITGTAQIRQGVLESSDFRIDGSSAKVTMQGQIDLNRETQNLKVRILPTVGNSVSLLGALAVSPLVGIGTLIINKILREPLDKLASYDYNVTGTWVNPNVTKAGQSTAGSTGKESNP